MIKNQQAKNRNTLLHPVKAIYENPTANIIANGKIVNVFSLIWGAGVFMFSSLYSTM